MDAAGDAVTGAAARDLLARDARVLWHPFSHGATEPELAPVVAAEGAWLVLADGRRVLDGISSWWTCLHGHGEPAIAAAIAEQARTLDHVVFAGATHPPAVELAERLLAIAPRGLARVFFSDDGSTAVEVALKLAVQRAWLRGERRLRFVALEGGYHGDTFGAMAVGDASIFTEPFARLLAAVDRVPAPRGLDDAAGCEASLAALRATLARGRGEVAAVITEPVLQGAAGMRLHPPAFLRGVRAACDEAGVPWIADEVLTGFGRTGALFACEHADVAPDLLCVAKGLTGGVLPLAATLCREDLFAEFQSGARTRAFFHGHSFTANPIACAAALASMELTTAPGFLPRARAIGERMRAGLEELRGDGRVRDVRGLGPLAAVELVEDGGFAADSVLRLRREALARGVLLRPLGPVLYALPPLCVTDGECDLLAATLVDLVRGR